MEAEVLSSTFTESQKLVMHRYLSWTAITANQDLTVVRVCTHPLIRDGSMEAED